MTVNYFIHKTDLILRETGEYIGNMDIGSAIFACFMIMIFGALSLAIYLLTLDKVEEV